MHSDKIGNLGYLKNKLPFFGTKQTSTLPNDALLLLV